MSPLFLAIPITIAVIAIVVAVLLSGKLNQVNEELDSLTRERTLLVNQQAELAAENKQLENRFLSITDLDEEKQRVLLEFESQRTTMEAEQAQLEARIATLREGAQQIVQKIQEKRQEVERKFQDRQQQIDAELQARRSHGEQELQARQAQREAEVAALEAKLQQLRTEIGVLDEAANLQSFGLYQPHYDFSSAENYRAELEEVRNRQKEMLNNMTAAVADQEWAIDGSIEEGRRQINQTLKLLLRGFNGECDAAIAKVRYSNIEVMEARIRKAFAVINDLASVQECRITPEYLELKVQELYLSHEHQEKARSEKEPQARIQDQMHEEETTQRPFR